MDHEMILGMDTRERNLPIMSSQSRSSDPNDHVLKPFPSPSATLSTTERDSPEMEDLVQGINIQKDFFTSETLVTHKSSGIRTVVKSKYKI